MEQHLRPTIDHYAWLRSSLGQPHLSDEACALIHRDMFGKDDLDENAPGVDVSDMDLPEHQEEPEAIEEEVINPLSHRLTGLLARYPALASYRNLLYQYFSSQPGVLSLFLVGHIVYQLLPDTSTLRVSIQVMKMVMDVDIPLSDNAL